MAKYIINGISCDFAKMSDKDIHAILDKHHRDETGKSTIYCGCNTAENLVLHTFNRDGELFLRKANGTGEKHRLGCRHRSITPEVAALLGYAPGAISSDEETLIINLSAPLTPKQEVTPLTRTESAVRSRNGRTVKRSLANRVTELGLLRLLWARAGLTTHVPDSADGKPWTALRYAAMAIKPSRLDMPFGLSQILLLPQTSDEDEQGKRNWAKLKDAYKRRYVLYLDILEGPAYETMLDNLAAGKNHVFSRATAAGGSAHRFKVKVGVYRDDALLIHNNLTAQFPLLRNQAAAGAKVAVFGVAEVCTVDDNGKVYYAKVRSMVGMPLTDQLIPFESSYEWEMAKHLVTAQRCFEKPFASEASIDERLAPDFILRDCSPPVMIEVYGMNTDDYLARKAEKREIYADEYPGAYWEWHANKESLQAALQQCALPSPNA